jgi:tripartite-type tricarboxylate transporter receptor subunit TctC
MRELKAAELLDAHATRDTTTVKTREAGMIFSRRSLLRGAAGSIALPAVSRVSLADDFPSRRITLIVPFAAGGGLDNLSRILAEGMRPVVGQPIIIETAPGADGTIGSGRVAQAAPDGYTVLVGAWNTHVTNAAIYSLKYDVVADFEPVILLPDAPMVLIAKKGVPVNNFKEFIGWLKSDGSKAALGTAGVGSPPDLLGHLLRAQTGTQFNLVPYRGAGPALQDVVAGQIDGMFVSIAPALPQIASGTVKAFAVTSHSRMSVAPEIPTMEELGSRQLAFAYWAALFAPKGTPKDIVQKLNLAARTALQDPAIKKRFEAQGIEIPPADQLSPEALAAHQKAEIAKWWPIVKASGAKPH